MNVIFRILLCTLWLNLTGCICTSGIKYPTPPERQEMNTKSRVKKKLEPYQYRSTIVRVIDGDTIIAEVDVGFDIYLRKRIRLAEIDCAEKSGKPLKLSNSIIKEKKLAKDATEAVTKYLNNGIFILEVRYPDAYGRYLAMIYVVGDDGIFCLNDRLIEEGLAKKY